MTYAYLSKFADLKHAQPAMHRLTARLLLVLLLVGTLAPVALAFAAPPPHACCMRRVLHDHGSLAAGFQATGGQHHNCCPPVITAHWAEFRAAVSGDSRLLVAHLSPASTPVFRTNMVNSLYSGRAPPVA